MTAPYNDKAPPPVNRLVIPNGTNAPLVTPETHRLVANKPVDQVSPSKLSNIKTTTANVLDEAIAHLVKVEPKLKPVVEKHHCRIFSAEGLAEEIDPFNALVSGIISQQVISCILRSYCQSADSILGLRSSSKEYQSEIRGTVQYRSAGCCSTLLPHAIPGLH
jgi:DNA-3-methyladenine glycosylase II